MNKTAKNVMKIAIQVLLPGISFKKIAPKIAESNHNQCVGHISILDRYYECNVTYRKTDGIKYTDSTHLEKCINEILSIKY